MASRKCTWRGNEHFEFGCLVKRLPTVVRAVVVVMIAVDQFVENQMTVGIVGQVGGAEQLGEIGAVVVEVAGHPDFAGGGKDDGLLVTQDGEAIFLGGGVESFGHLGEAGHGVIRRRIGGIRQADHILMAGRQLNRSKSRK